MEMIWNDDIGIRTVGAGFKPAPTFVCLAVSEGGGWLVEDVGNITGKAW